MLLLPTQLVLVGSVGTTNRDIYGHDEPTDTVNIQ